MVQVYEKEGITCAEMTVPRMANPVFVFFVDGMLIDTGPQNLESELISFYENISFDIVTLTHHHEDHTGTAPWIQENRNVPIYIHPKGIDICAEVCPYPEYRQIMWGIRKKFKALPIKDTIQSRTKEWKVIDTPGHADDHISLFDKETGTLFSGDLYVSPKTKIMMKNESVPQIMDSIRTVLTYDFRSMFCCHAGYIPDGKVKLKQKLEYLENLYGEVKSLYETGLSNEEIDKKIFRKKYTLTSASDGEWDSLHIISSIVSDIVVGNSK